MIIGEETKAAEAAARSSVPSGLVVCSHRPDLPREIQTLAPRFARIERACPGNGTSSHQEEHQQLLDSMVFNICDGSLRSGMFMCFNPASNGSSTLMAQSSVISLRALHPTWRVLKVDFDLEAAPKPALEPNPTLLQIFLTRTRDGVPPAESSSSVVHVAWPQAAPVGDAEAMAVMRTLVIPMALSFAPDLVVFSMNLSPGLSAPVCARMMRCLMGLAHGRVVLNVRAPWDRPQSATCASACMAALLGLDLAPLPQAELCCDLATMSLLETIVAPLASAWPCLNNTISFRLLSEKQFCTVQGDDTVMATVALACLSMTSVREEDEDALQEGNRKRSLSVTGGAAALLKVRNSCSSPTS